MTAVPLSRLDRNESSPLLPTACTSLHQEADIQDSCDSLIYRVAHLFLEMVVSIGVGIATTSAFRGSPNLREGLMLGAGVCLACNCVQKLYNCVSQSEETCLHSVGRVIITLATIFLVYPILVSAIDGSKV